MLQSLTSVCAFENTRIPPLRMPALVKTVTGGGQRPRATAVAGAYGWTLRSTPSSA